VFNSLTGTIGGFEFPLVFLQTGSVEWEVEVSAATFRALVSERHDQRCTVYLHLNVRDDALKLFGFATIDERIAFRRLITVNGIGPRQAIRILSGTSVEALQRNLDNEDVDALSLIPGLGKKTAQKMILALKGTIVGVDRSAGDGQGTPRDDLVEALVEMGFDRAAARATVSRLRDDDTAGEEEIFRLAIVELSSSQDGR
jgi:Holliday junction DNA helicase RuvA